MVSAALEWSVISLLKEFVFVVIIFSAYMTWHSTFLFPKREMKKSKTKIKPSHINLENHNGAEEEKRDKQQSKVLGTFSVTDFESKFGQILDTYTANEGIKDERKIEEIQQSVVQETCSALGRCICSLSFCFFAPFTSTCCKFARGENPYSFTFYLANGFNFFWRGFQLRFLTAFGDFSSGLVSLLSAPVEDEDSRFFALKSSLS